jgi:hypothetical protein
LGRSENNRLKPFKNSNLGFRFNTHFTLRQCVQSIPHIETPRRSHFYNDTIASAKDGYFPNDPIYTFIVSSRIVYKLHNDITLNKFMQILDNLNHITTNIHYFKSENYSQQFFLATTKLFIESGNVYIETKRNVDPYIAFLMHPCVVVWRENQV